MITRIYYPPIQHLNGTLESPPPLGSQATPAVVPDQPIVFTTAGGKTSLSLTDIQRELVFTTLGGENYVDRKFLITGKDTQGTPISFTIYGPTGSESDDYFPGFKSVSTLGVQFQTIDSIVMIDGATIPENELLISLGARGRTKWMDYSHNQTDFSSFSLQVVTPRTSEDPSTLSYDIYQTASVVSYIRNGIEYRYPNASLYDDTPGNPNKIVDIDEVAEFPVSAAAINGNSFYTNVTRLTTPPIGVANAVSVKFYYSDATATLLTDQAVVTFLQGDKQ